MAINIHQDRTLGRAVDPDTGRGDSPERRIQSFIDQSTVMLFVKGTPAQPMCGFSATVMDIFNRIGEPFATFNILDDPEIRAGAKSFTQWPTFPQVYVGGEFVGGCDIAIEMFQSGELQPLVKDAVASKGPGALHGGAAAAPEGEGEARGEARGEAQGGGAVIVAPDSARAQGEGLAEVRQIRPRKVALMGSESFVIIDVRKPEEQAFSRLEDAHLIPLDELEARFAEIPRDANILLQCRSGGRSHRAGELLVAKGYRHVWNLDGGINAWSDEVDQSIPKY